MPKIRTKFRKDKKNARLHPDTNKELIRQSLSEVGGGRSILVDGDGIVRAGNATFEQATKLGMEIVPVAAKPHQLIAVVRKDLKGRAAERAALLDNRAGDLSLFDRAALAEIADRDRSLLDNIFSGQEISALGRLARASERARQTFGYTEPDSGETIPYKCELGQVWEIPSASVPTKSHRLVIGNSRDGYIVEAALGGEKAIGVFTSPPYAEQRKAKYGGVPPDDYLEWFDLIQTNIANHLSEEGSFFLNLKAHCEQGERVTYVFDLVLAMKRKWGWKFIDELSWVKPGYPGDMGKRFRNGFEPIYQFAKSDAYKFRMDNVLEFRQSNFSGYHENLAQVQGERGSYHVDELLEVRPSNVLHLMPDTTSLEETAHHPARFPPHLPEFFVRAYSDVGDVWLDPFMGSGSTFIACEQEGRIGAGIELDPIYAAAGLFRLEKNFGLAPRLLGLVKNPRRTPKKSARNGSTR